MAAPPRWASQLLMDVLIDHHQSEPVTLDWRRSKKNITSSGRTFCDERRIVVTAGKNRTDAKLVLLHEIAHILSPNGEHHGAAFWDVAWTLFRDYKVPMAYAQRREFKYRVAAIAGYKRIIGKRALHVRPARQHRHTWKFVRRDETYAHFTCNKCGAYMGMLRKPEAI